MSITRPRRRLGAVAMLSVIGAAAFAVASPASAQTPEYVAEYADARFQKQGTELRLAPGQIDDQGTLSEVLEASVFQQSCQGRFLVTVDVAADLEAPDIPGLEIDARGGSATLQGTVDLTGTITFTPAGRRCATPVESAAITSPVTTAVTVDATWRNNRGVAPVEYSGAECGGNGQCYYRGAIARATWDSDILGSASARTDDAFLFEGVYPIDLAALAVIPSV